MLLLARATTSPQRLTPSLDPYAPEISHNHNKNGHRKNPTNTRSLNRHFLIPGITFFYLFLTTAPVDLIYRVQHDRSAINTFSRPQNLDIRFYIRLSLFHNLLLDLETQAATTLLFP